MTRASLKARAPRQYIFDGVSKERLSAFRREIRAMRQRELRVERLAREAAAERTRTAAGVHAAAIVTAARARHAEEDELAAMERELEELVRRKKQLFEDLKRSLENGSKAPPRVRKTPPSAANGDAGRTPAATHAPAAAPPAGTASTTGGATGAAPANVPPAVGNAKDGKVQEQQQPVAKTAYTEPWKR